MESSCAETEIWDRVWHRFFAPEEQHVYSFVT